MLKQILTLLNRNQVTDITKKKEQAEMRKKQRMKFAMHGSLGSSMFPLMTPRPFMPKDGNLQPKTQDKGPNQSFLSVQAPM